MLPAGLSPMLATTAALPLRDGWAYKVKWDGVRALVAVSPGGVTATSRNGNQVSGGYPELRALAGPEVLLDGELGVRSSGAESCAKRRRLGSYLRFGGVASGSELPVGLAASITESMTAWV